MNWPKRLSPRLLSEFWNWVWLKVLKVSSRSCNPLFSVKAKVLKRERFQLSRPGPRRALWPRLPQLPAAGVRKHGGIEVLDDAGRGLRSAPPNAYI